MEPNESIVRCPLCKEDIQKDAIKCKHCSSILVPISNPIYQSKKEGSLWVSVVSFIFGIFVAAASLDESRWDHATIKGFIAFTLISFLCGLISVSKKLEGQGIAIAGIILSVLATLMVTGG